MKRNLVGGLAVVAVLLASCSGATVSQAHTNLAGRTTGATRPHIPALTTMPPPPPLTPLPAPTTTTTQPTSGPQVEDLTWVSVLHGWALVARCGVPDCTQVLTTTDGGASWAPVAPIAAASGACLVQCYANVPEVTHIRFANDLDGYAFGPNLFVTTDGGYSWSMVAGPMVAALEPAGGNVIRVVYTQTGCPGPCDLTVQEAPAGSEAWHTLKAPFRGDAVQLVRQGAAEVYMATFANPAGGAGSAHATLSISHNGGITWTERTDPCGELDGDEFDTSSLAAAPASVVTVLCTGRVQQQAFVAVSVDGGADFTRRPVLPGPDFCRTIAATSRSSIFLSGYTTSLSTSVQLALWASRDGGQRWAQVASETGSLNDSYSLPGFLGFESAAVGRWVGAALDLWSTTDGGAHWVNQPIP